MGVSELACNCVDECVILIGAKCCRRFKFVLCGRAKCDDRVTCDAPNESAKLQRATKMQMATSALGESLIFLSPRSVVLHVIQNRQSLDESGPLMEL